MDEIKISHTFNKLVIQPTTFCNVNCDYCYLPNRNEKKNLTFELAQNIAENIKNFTQKISIIWHGGEPLSIGLQAFKKIYSPFIPLQKENRITNSIQTNATLLNDDWCNFFIENDFKVGISIDGNFKHNEGRVDNKNRPFFDKIVKGSEVLKRNKIPFYIIAVINQRNINDIEEIYDFFLQLGCWSVGFNLEEQEGINIVKKPFSEQQVEQFWDTLFKKWIQNPQIRVREFDKVLTWLDYDLSINNTLSDNFIIDLFPSISAEGNISLLSPEFLGQKLNKDEGFIIGNIQLNSLISLLEKGISVKYVEDYKKGINLCSKSCNIFAYCRGGQASNKFFENGNIASTQTKYCINSKILLLKTVNKILINGNIS